METCFVVDRVEGKVAVCEVYGTKQMVDIALDQIGIQIKTGDVLRCKDGKYIRDEEKKKQLQKELFALQQKLFKK